VRAAHPPVLMHSSPQWHTQRTCATLRADSFCALRITISAFGYISHAFL
jgi:hypothetical protein